jgi:hypothetical protein
VETAAAARRAKEVRILTKEGAGERRGGRVLMSDGKREGGSCVRKKGRKEGRKGKRKKRRTTGETVLRAPDKADPTVRDTDGERCCPIFAPQYSRPNEANE